MMSSDKAVCVNSFYIDDLAPGRRDDFSIAMNAEILGEKEVRIDEKVKT